MSMRFILGLLIGMAIGASIALAIAPQGGESTRKEILRKAKDQVSSLTG